MDPLSLLRGQLAAAWRWRWPALAFSWLVCLAGWAGVQTLPDQYQASARIYADADAILGQTLRGIAVDGATAAQVETLQRTLLARPNLERIVARTDLDLRVTDEASRERLIRSLERDIRLQPQARNLFRLEYADSDPRLAHDVVRATLNLFIERAATNDRQQMENARSFVSQQIAAYETQLREAERRRADFRARYLELLPNDAGFSRLEQSRSRLQQLRGELEDMRVRRDLLKQQVEATPAMLAPEAVGGGAGGPVAQAERELRELRLRFTDDHPAVQQQRRVIAELRQSGGGGAGRAAAARPRANPVREQLQGRLIEVEADLQSLERQVRVEEGEVERLEALARGAPQVQAEFMNLDRDYSVLRRNYDELLARRESLQIAGAARSGADQVRLEVIEPPVVPTEPSGPKRLLLSAVVLVLGLGAGGALAFLLGLTDRSFRSIHDLRRIGLPVLGAISSLTERRRRGGAAAFGGAVALLLLCFGAVATRGREIFERFIA
jgi:polysaccharide chain length determinant protein (PEP-CTERM system associated)